MSDGSDARYACALAITTILIDEVSVATTAFLSLVDRERTVTGRGDDLLFAGNGLASGQLETLLLGAGEWLVDRRHIASSWAGRTRHFGSDSVAIYQQLSW